MSYPSQQRNTTQALAGFVALLCLAGGASSWAAPVPVADQDPAVVEAKISERAETLDTSAKLLVEEPVDTTLEVEPEGEKLNELAIEPKMSQVPVPLPAAAWLFGSALFGFVFLSNRKRV